LKHYSPGYMKPNSNDFSHFISGKLSKEAGSSESYRAIRGLFSISSILYGELMRLTSENLITFSTAGKYLSAAQEQSAMALTAAYIEVIGRYRESELKTIIDNDPGISEQDKLVLHLALELYQNSAQSARVALGSPQWV
jgi:hypothetical protein